MYLAPTAAAQAPVLTLIFNYIYRILYSCCQNYVMVPYRWTDPPGFSG